MASKGFALVEIIIIAIIFGLLALIGAIYLGGNQEVTQSFITPAISTQPSVQPQASPNAEEPKIPNEQLMMGGIPTVQEIINLVVLNQSVLELVRVDDNTESRVKLTMFFDAKDGAHSFDEITEGWKFGGSASSPCYSNAGYYKGDIGLMVASGSSSVEFPEYPGGVGAQRYCTTADKYYVEIIYEQDAWWCQKT